MPDSGYGLRSVAARSPEAGPIDATLEVTTTRETPHCAAVSTATRGPTAFTRQTWRRGRDATMPAVWNSTSQPSSARRIERRSSTSASKTSTSQPASAVSRRRSRTVTRTSSPRCARRAATCAPT